MTTTKEQGIWDLDEVYNKIDQGSIWTYDASGFTPTDSKTLFGWFGNWGASGTNKGPAYYSSPVQLGTSEKWKDIGIGKEAGPVAAIKTDGSMWTWGNNAKGQLGQNNTTTYSSPKQIPGTTWNIISSSYEGCYGIKTDGTLWSWGYNLYGAMGINSRVNHSSPVQIPGFSNPVSFATGRRNWVIKLG